MLRVYFERWLFLTHEECYTPECPHVYFVVIWQFFKYFWSCVPRCASSIDLIAAFHLLSHSKITDFVAWLCDEHVLRFDVHMYEVHTVQKRQSLTAVFQHCPYFVFFVYLSLNCLSQIAFLSVLQDQVKFVFGFKAMVEPNNVMVMQLRHNLNFFLCFYSLHIALLIRLCYKIQIDLF